MLTATSLHKKFGPAVALHSLDLTVAPGEIYALLGPNGAGKTTTINCFLGFLTPDAGSASVAGINVALNPLAARRALSCTFPREPALIREGGSIPIVQSFRDILGVETLLLGLALPDCQAHAPNENFPIGNFEAGILLNQALLEEIASA